MQCRMNSLSREQIISEITAAFDGIPRGKITLHEAFVIDTGGSEKQQRAAHKHDTEHRWQDVRDSDIEHHPSTLCYVCPGSFRYYLAAYMVWSLRHYDTTASSSLEFTIGALCPNTNKPRYKHEGAALLALFTPGQTTAIRHFLAFMAQEGDPGNRFEAQLALDVYWDPKHPV
jgi:hypothetical protein